MITPRPFIGDGCTPPARTVDTYLVESVYARLFELRSGHEILVLVFRFVLFQFGTTGIGVDAKDREESDYSRAQAASEG